MTAVYPGKSAHQVVAYRLEIRRHKTDLRVILRQWLKPWECTKSLKEKEKCGLFGAMHTGEIGERTQKQVHMIVCFR